MLSKKTNLIVALSIMSLGTTQAQVLDSTEGTSDFPVVRLELEYEGYPVELDVYAPDYTHDSPEDYLLELGGFVPSVLIPELDLEIQQMDHNQAGRFNIPKTIRKLRDGIPKIIPKIFKPKRPVQTIPVRTKDVLKTLKNCYIEAPLSLEDRSDWENIRACSSLIYELISPTYKTDASLCHCAFNFMSAALNVIGSCLDRNGVPGSRLSEDPFHQIRNRYQRACWGH